MKICKYIIAIVVLALTTLLVVHVVFLIPAPFKWLQANWTADGILAFLGAIVAAISTIFVFAKTLEYNRKKDNDDKKFQIKPCLFTTVDLFDMLSENKEIDENAIVINIDETIYCTKTTLRGYQKKYFSLDSRERTKIINRQDNYYDIKYCITNVGVGNAVNLTLKIDDRQAANSLALQVGKCNYYIISLNRGLLNKDKDYIKLDLIYYDATFNCKYIQKETLRFFVNHKYGVTSRNDDKLTPPKEMFFNNSEFVER